MEYKDITPGRFCGRKNRFIAQVEVQEGAGVRRETVHVKNTGRCRELFVPGAEVWLEKSVAKGRKTAYDLVGVKKGDSIVNVDSNAPNRAVKEWLEAGGFFPDVTLVRPESAYGGSRFDFYVEAGGKKIFIEVKGVTLERQSMAMFPDAPSLRALKHVEELRQATLKGYECYVLFIIQMKGVSGFAPNRETQPEFADALLLARRAGVRVLAYDCLVTENSMRISEPVPVILEEDEALLCHIAQPLLVWYDANRRSLPWRESPTPYRVWVSEIMLQQTRVEAVRPYYQRFMDALPDVAALAAVPEDVLLKLWEGLGYYSRARNLKKAAISVMEEYGGQMPADYEELKKLSGIGSYTAGAIASIAFGQAVPAVDGNVLRVLARLLAFDADVSNPAVKRDVEQRLLPVMPGERPGDFNQALMELGATVCVPNGAPKCEECPWNGLCRANREGTQLQYPKKSAKKPRQIEKYTVLVIRDASRVALRRRPEGGLLAGLYEFPSLNGHVPKEEVLLWLKERGLDAVRIKKLPSAKHIFTHREWHMEGFLVWADRTERMETEDALVFVRPEETKERYPIPSAYAAYTRYLEIKTGSARIREENDKKSVKKGKEE